MTYGSLGFLVETDRFPCWSNFSKDSGFRAGIYAVLQVTSDHFDVHKSLVMFIWTLTFWQLLRFVKYLGSEFSLFVFTISWLRDLFLGSVIGSVNFSSGGYCVAGCAPIVGTSLITTAETLSLIHWCWVQQTDLWGILVSDGFIRRKLYF